MSSCCVQNREGQIRKYFLKLKGEFALVVLLTLLGTVLSILFAFMLRDMIDAGTKSDMQGFSRNFILVTAFLILQIPINAANQLVQAGFVKKFMYAFKNDLFNSILKKDFRQLNAENSAKDISNLTNDMSMLEQLYVLNIFGFISNILSFCFATFAIIRLSPVISAAILICTVLPLMIPLVLNKRVAGAKKAYSDSLGEFTSRIKDMFTGIEVIKAYNIEEKILGEFRASNMKAEQAKYRSSRINTLVDGLSWFFGLFSFIGVFGLGIYFVSKGSMTIGSLLAITQLTNSVTGPVINLSTRINSIKSVRLIKEQLLAAIKKGNVVETAGVSKESFESRISFRDVSFSYGEHKQALKGFSFEFEKGKKYAIVGGSGSGKSTMLRLLLRYHDDFSGSISLDGVDNRKIRTESLYRLVCVMHQNVFMFDAGIKENITLFQNYSKEELDNAVERSRLSGFIGSLPSGIDTKAGENGCNISGGEKQRISIARALIKNTPILVLDEATSSLDNENSYIIEKLILEIPGKTCIMVTHKMHDDLLAKFDSIIVLKNGRIAEAGSFTDLLNRKEHFYSLYNVTKMQD